MKRLHDQSVEKQLSAMNVAGCKPPIHIDLDKGSLIAVPDAFEIVVRCTSGTLWITQLGNARDLVVHGGESMAIEKGEDTLIHAVTAASVELRLAVIGQSQLMMDFAQGCYALKFAAMKQVMKIRGKCRIRVGGNGSAVCVQ